MFCVCLSEVCLWIHAMGGVKQEQTDAPASKDSQHIDTAQEEVRSYISSITLSIMLSQNTSVM